MGHQAGARGYVSKNPPRADELLKAVLAALAGALGVAYKTIANTCGHIKEKLGLSTTADLIRIAIGRGLA